MDFCFPCCVEAHANSRPVCAEYLDSVYAIDMSAK